ncbi:MAG: cytochrome b5 domain-containing protein [Thainema sp.]
MSNNIKAQVLERQRTESPQQLEDLESVDTVQTVNSSNSQTAQKPIDLPNLDPNLQQNNSTQKPAMVAPERTSTLMPNVWVYDGDAYDLTEFMTKHPGGEFFIGRMKNRDITTLVNVLHRNPAKAKQRLKQYALGRKATPEDLHPKCNAPPFLFKPNFDGRVDTPTFDFDNPDQLLNRIRDRINHPTVQAQIARVDVWFDVTAVVLLVMYVAVQVLRLELTPWMPLYLFVPLMVGLRIALSGVGHYLNHRPMVGFNKFACHVFDINYVPMAFVVVDGHTLLHHPYTQTDVDVKQNVFTAMMDLPRYYRMPLHTLHKLGHVATGMLMRMAELCINGVKYGVEDMYGNRQRAFPHYAGLVAMRLLLLGECVIFALNGQFWAWLAQFVVTLWISTFMIVASHDFEDDQTHTDVKAESDWAVWQIQTSYDLTMIGNKYVDCFLSAGLSPHRVHHVLPYQRSGFANIISEDIVREEAAKFNLPWHPPKNFFCDRLPLMSRHYLLSPSRQAKEENLNIWQEHFNPLALKTAVTYVYKGFIGIGSI